MGQQDVVWDGSEGPGPIFIGGSGRSGTWVLGRMLDRDPRFVAVPTEIRFHSVPGGFPELLSGQNDHERFAARMREYWYRREGPDGSTRGLHLLVEERDFDDAVDAYLEHFDVDRTAALRGLFLTMVVDLVRDGEGYTFVETTPRNVRAASTLVTVFPHAKIIHTVRDGRDVAASVVRMPWGPDDLIEAVEWWADRVLEGHAGSVGLGPDRLHVVRLEELVQLNREPAFEGLVRFLGGDPGDQMRKYFDAHMNRERGHLGRYKDEVSVNILPSFESAYENQLERLRDAGATCLPITANRS